jgi:hypothetical protein
MKFKDAVRQSIREFYNGTLPENSTGEDFPYTPEYFDDLTAKEAEDREESDNDESA